MLTTDSPPCPDCGSISTWQPAQSAYVCLNCGTAHGTPAPSPATTLDTCSDCGEPTEVFVEGYCAECHEKRQQQLDAHHARFARWSRLTPAQREQEIRDAYRNA